MAEPNAQPSLKSGLTTIRPETLSKKRLQHLCFSMNIKKFLRTDFLEQLWWLLLAHECSKSFIEGTTFLKDFVRNIVQKH